MSNSPLVSYTMLSPNKTSPRNHKIDTVTVHCMAGDLSVERCGALFADPKRQASSNYGIGSDGRIALYVEECDRSWCSSNRENDHRAVTIEVANTEAKAPWPVSQAAYDALIDLLEDICRRNGIEKLRWQGAPSLVGRPEEQNMTVHRWFAAKECPGDYLYNLHGRIEEEVNARLESSAETDNAGRFSDVPSGVWYAEAVEGVADLGIMIGTGEDRFEPDRPMTRAEVAAALWKFYQVSMKEKLK